MSEDPRMKYITHISAEGTLGDLFIVLCKCSYLHKASGLPISLSMWCDQKIMFDPMEKICDGIPWLTFVLRFGKHPYHGTGNFINSLAQDPDAKTPKDPEGILMDPYPELIDVKGYEGKNQVAIQLFAGRWAGNNLGNFRAFSKETVKDICSSTIKNGMIPVVFGTDTPILDLDAYRDVVKSAGGGFFIFDDIIGGARLLSRSDFLFAPIGFYTFVALSMKKFCHTFYTHDTNILRIHPEWWKHCEASKRPTGEYGIFQKIEVE